jgi:hypothetical protein
MTKDKIELLKKIVYEICKKYDVPTSIKEQ